MSDRHNAKEKNKTITEFIVPEEESKSKNISIILGQVKEELDEHLDTLNANTDEIQAAFECVNEIETKIDKLNEKIEQIQLFLGMKQQNERKYKDIKLTFKEQELFLVMYTSEEALSAEDFSKQTGLILSDVNRCLKMMLYKGIPLLKKDIAGTTRFVLDPDFKQLQAKENILEIGERVMSRLN